VGSRGDLPKLLLEKLPLLALAASSSIVTFIVQQRGGAMADFEAIPMMSRVANACIAYFAYIWKMFWPVDLAVLYPAAAEVSAWWIAAGAGLIGGTLLSIWAGVRRPYIAVGWLWYVGTLVPVIGLVQVGRQSMADRYTYVPLIGLFLVVAFGIHDAVSSNARRSILPAAALATLGACIWLSSDQVSYWSTSNALWERTLSVTTNNAAAHFKYGAALEESGKLDEALRHYRDALRIEPDYAEAHYNLANGLMKAGATADSLAEAGTHLTAALQLNPDFAEAHNATGVHSLMRGEIESAVAHFKDAIRLKADYALAHNNLGTALGNQGRFDDAILSYKQAVTVDPGYAEAHANVAVLLAQQGKNDDAISHLKEALRVNPDNKMARDLLARLKTD
jgi:tetratricopeptide (TPR) repeat protein